jgi:hypothetical protein
MNESNQQAVKEIVNLISIKVKSMQSLERIMRQHYLVKYDEYCMTEIRQFVDTVFWEKITQYLPAEEADECYNSSSQQALDESMREDVYKKLNLEDGHSCHPFGKQGDMNKANQIVI